MTRVTTHRSAAIATLSALLAAGGLAILGGAAAAGRNAGEDSPRASAALDARANGAAAAGNFADAGMGVADETRIQWKTGAIRTSHAHAAADAARIRGRVEATVDSLRASDRRHGVIQFARPITPAERESLQAAGVSLLAFLSDHAYFAALNANPIDVAGIVAAAPVWFMSEVEPAWKLHPMYHERRVPEWTIVEADKSAEEGWPASDARGANPVVAALVLFHGDVNPDDGANIAIQQGANVRTRIVSANALLIELPYQAIFSLAVEDAVQWIEPPLPQLSPNNLENRALTGANVVQAAPYNLDGTGVKAFIYDAGKAFAGHADFAGRMTILPSDTSSQIDHATHVAGTVGGSGAASGGTQRGMAPGVTLYSAGFEWNGTPYFLYNNPGDIEADFGNAIATYGVEISNSSIGTNTESNGFPCEIQGDYGLTDVIIDGIARGSLSGGVPFRLVWADGNERQGTRCNVEGFGSYYSTAPPATAKNHLAIGAVNANDDSIASFSSWGPTDDGRMKPDFSAPGCQVGGDNGVTSCVSSGGYASFCGTSMASPTVCGLSCLLLEDYKANYPGEPLPRNSTLKAIYATTAMDRGNPGPDYQFGYGSVRIQPAIDLERAGNFLEDTVSQGGVYSAVVVVGPADTQLKVTLAWDDPPGTPNVVPSLINNLDLRVYDASNTLYYPWTLDKLNPPANAVRTQPNSLDNLEQVVIDNAPPGAYRVEVAGTSVPQGPQAFSLASATSLFKCSSTGVAQLDRGRYACVSTAAIRVIDCDLNTNDAVVDTVNVAVASTSEPGGEIVTLSESAPASADFGGSIGLSTTNAAGVLLVAAGDTLTMTYTDADDGQGGTNVPVIDSADVDCSPPNISNVQVSNIKARSATVTFSTNEPARGQVDYGTDCGALGGSLAESGLGTSHTLQLTGLTDSTPYDFRVAATDEAGNSAVSDNGGVCFQFETPRLTNYFTELFTGDNDLDFKSISFRPAANVDQYVACATTIGALPTDPAGGTPISIASDDASILVSLSGGKKVSLYGAQYGSFYVSANAYITFGAPDAEYTESLADHFNLPRISALFDDFSPQNGGQVSWKQLSDRVAVTWLNIPEYNVANQNTLQIVMYFDGRLELNYLSLAATDGLAGLSAGLGVDPEFEEANLGGSDDCGPFPPLASAVQAAGPADAPLGIALTAIDEGTPGPMSFLVTSLPGFTLKDAGNDHVIKPSELPYTLINHGNQLTYVPGAGYNGSDHFQFKANDGGAPPTGGDSNVADVSIAIGTPQPIVVFPMDADPGWTTEGQWAFGVPTGGGSHQHDPTSGFTGPNVYGYNLNGDYANGINPPHYLTTGALDFTGYSAVTLRFRRWLGVDQFLFDHASISISADGVNWTTVWNHNGAAINEGAWSLQTYDLSAVADRQPAVYVRWAMGNTNGSGTYPGWNIDDVEFLALADSPPCSPCDANCDGTVNQFDIQPFIQQLIPPTPDGCSPCAADANSDGTVNQFDIQGFIDCLS